MTLQLILLCEVGPVDVKIASNGKRGYYSPLVVKMGPRAENVSWVREMNSTKIDILKCLSNGDWWTTPEVAQECGLSLTNISELLRRYRSQSLVNRERNPDVPRGYLYRITNVGLDRLQYLVSDVVETSSTIASKAGLSGAKKRVLDRWIQQKLRR